MTIKRSILIGMFSIAILPISALALVKSLRVVVPQIVSGVHCYDRVCTDDKGRLAEAQALYSTAITQTAEKVGAFRSQPTIVFCSTARCQDGFGLGAKAACTIGTFGTAVSPRGWKQFFITHELIHYRQNEELGILTVLRKPSWLIEGMAYSLSDDPRRLLTQPFESWRVKFEDWNNPPHSNFWQAANKAE